MRSLILLRRPGILVVSGVVVWVSNSEVQIRNTFGAQKIDLILKSDPKLLEALKLAKGSMLVASTMDDFKIELLMDGAILTEPVTLNAYTIRYNGSFDFEAKGTRKEEHVFAGSVLSATVGRKAGRQVCAATIGWRKKGREEIRNVLFDPAKVTDCSAEALQKQKLFFVTEGKREEKDHSYYVANAVFTG